MNIIKRTLFLFFACFLCQANSTAHPRYRRINVRSAKNLARPSYNRQTGFSNLRNSTFVILRGGNAKGTSQIDTLRIQKPFGLEKITSTNERRLQANRMANCHFYFYRVKSVFYDRCRNKNPRHAKLRAQRTSNNFYSILYTVYEIEHPRNLWLRHPSWTNINLDHNHDDRLRELCT